MVICELFCLQIAIWLFDQLFQIWWMVIWQLFCRRIAIRPFRLKLKCKGNLRYTECTIKIKRNHETLTRWRLLNAEIQTWSITHAPLPYILDAFKSSKNMNNELQRNLLRAANKGFKGFTRKREAVAQWTGKCNGILIGHKTYISGV